MTVAVTAGQVATAFARRAAPVRGLAADADALAAACRAMARRFARGGRLLAFGEGCAAADAAHVVVEFVHPVIVGKRALPAAALAPPFPVQVELFGEPADIALGIAAGGRDDAVTAALAAARRRGLLTIALLGGDAPAPEVDHAITVGSDDPRIVREGQVTAYHVLWELVHVFLESGEDVG